MLRASLVAIGLMCAAIGAPASASVTISFAGGNSAVTGTSGNIATYSTGGVSVQASAWSVSDWSLSTAWLGQYANGLGVTNSSEDGNSGNSAAIDNVGQNDFVLLVFSRPVSLLSAVLTPYQVSQGSVRNDATISFANLAGAFTAPAPTPVGMGSPLWLTLLDNESSSSGNSIAPYTTALTPGTNYGNVWAIGADMSHMSDSDHLSDGFRLTSITLASSPVPEPATWLTMLLGLGAVATLFKTRSSKIGQFSQVA